jgi:hypothetical protein
MAPPKSSSNSSLPKNKSGSDVSTRHVKLSNHLLVLCLLSYPFIHFAINTNIISANTADNDHYLSKRLCKQIQAKCFQYIWLSYVRNLIQQNPHVDFSIHLHMYDLKVVTTPRNWEKEAPVDSLKTVHEIIARSMIFEDLPPIPVNIVTSNHTEFDQTRLSWLDPSDQIFDYDLHTKMNIFRQGNSMEHAFFSALGMRRPGENLVMSNGVRQCGNSTVFLFLRSDTLLLSPIIIPNGGIASKSIIIPTWESWRGHDYNDRLAMAGSHAAAIYAEAKTNGYKNMILNQKSKNISLYLLGTSEGMLKSWLDKHENELNLTLLDDWAKLVRIRANGLINGRDKNEFGLPSNLNYVQNLSFAWKPVY